MERDLNVIIDSKLKDLNDKRMEILGNLKEVNEELDIIEESQKKLADKQYLLDTAPREVLKSIENIVDSDDKNYIADLYSSLFASKDSENNNENIISNAEESQVADINITESVDNSESTNVEELEPIELEKNLVEVEEVIPEDTFDLGEDVSKVNDFYEKLRYGDEDIEA